MEKFHQNKPQAYTDIFTEEKLYRKNRLKRDRWRIKLQASREKTPLEKGKSLKRIIEIE